VRINDGEGEKDIWRVDSQAILAVSDEAPSSADDTIMDSI